MKIDLSALKNALKQLETSMNYLRKEKDQGLIEQFRNSAIQCFEFTYELAYKTVRRHLEQIVSSADEIRQMNFNDLIRTAADSGIIPDVKRFIKYRERRNITSHVYNRKKAVEVTEVLEDFIKDVHIILNNLEKHHE